MTLASRTWLTVVAGACAIVGAASSAGWGCMIAPPVSLATAATPGAGGGGGAGANLGEEKFHALEAEMVAACASCHDAGGIADTPFLAGPDRYQTIVSWPGVVKAAPAESVMLTHPTSGGGHAGPNLDSPELAGTLLPKVKDWLAEEAKDIGGDESQHVAPFAPILGFNAVYLDALGGELAGMALTFDAELLGEGSIELAHVEVHPTAKAGVHVVHPLFAVASIGGDLDPDPVDSFSNVDQTFDAGQGGPLGPGLIVLTNWKKGAKLSIAFEKIEAVVPPVLDGGATDGGPGGGCTDEASFEANARGPLKGDCFGCHGGADAKAQNAVDMSKLDADPAAACAQVRNRVSPGAPASSQIFVTTNPGGNAAHPFKFGGDPAQFDAFMGSVSVWIAAEQ